jgi:hypothetical protein
MVVVTTTSRATSRAEERGAAGIIRHVDSAHRWDDWLKAWRVCHESNVFFFEASSVSDGAEIFPLIRNAGRPSRTIVSKVTSKPAPVFSGANSIIFTFFCEAPI